MSKNIFTEIKKRLRIGIEWLKPKASAAIKIINAVKKAVENPVLQDVIDFTGTKLDDQILALARKYLAKSAEQMLIAEGLLQAGSDQQTIMNTIIDYLRSKSKEARAKWWRELQAKLTVYLADGKIDEMEALSLGQMIYKELQNPEAAAA